MLCEIGMGVSCSESCSVLIACFSLTVMTSGLCCVRSVPLKKSWALNGAESLCMSCGSLEGTTLHSIPLRLPSLAMASLAQSSSRLCGKSSSDGVPSALELERRCGLRLRQIRRADLLLGVYDVMRVADAEFGLRVSRDVAGRWLELCGAAASSDRALEIESAEELERRFGPFLRIAGFAEDGVGRPGPALEVFSAHQMTPPPVPTNSRKRIPTAR